MAALVGPAASAIGKLNGLTTAKTPCGRRIERVWTGAVAEVAHRVVVERVVLGGLRVVADEVGGLLDLAEGLDAVLADLERHDRRLVHQPIADELGGALAGCATRSGHGVFAHAGCAARAAATASSTSAAVPGRERPERRLASRSACAPRTLPSPSRHAPST